MANIWYIQVNRFCNNKCIFCSNPSNSRSISLKRWIELIDDFVSKKYSWIIFTWWEPTLSKNLEDWIKYSTSKNLDCRVISNWMKCAKLEYIQKLQKSWLKLIHFSLYSYIPKIHDFLTSTLWSYNKVIKAIQNAIKLWMDVQLNCVINKYNEEHLDKNIIFILKNFPQIKHFVWNNLDPTMMEQNKKSLSSLPDFEIAWKSLKKALKLLDDNNKTYRVERLPLCFMRGYEFASTETRKIVKNEERIVHFLDFRDSFLESDWQHDKVEECSKCDLNSICAWIYEREKYYNYVKVKSQKLTQEEKEKIILKIKKYN